MAIIKCKLTDCAKHGIDICTAKEITINCVGQCECYSPVPRSAIVHEQFNSNCHKSGGRYKTDHRLVFK